MSSKATGMWTIGGLFLLKTEKSMRVFLGRFVYLPMEAIFFCTTVKPYTLFFFFFFFSF